MEGGKSACNNQGKKKTTVSTGVFNCGGIGGVLILGGALAASAAIAIFANKRNRGRPRKKDQTIASESSKNFNLNDKSNTHEETEEGLQLLVQPSPPAAHLNPCCKSNKTPEMGSAQTGPNELISTQNSILGEISEFEINGGKETLKIGDDENETPLSEITNPENISLCKDNGIVDEEYKLEEEVNKINDAGEEPPLLEAIEDVEKEEEASETVLEKQIEEEVYKINDAGEQPPLLEIIKEVEKEEEASETVLEADVYKINDAGEESPLLESIDKAKKEEGAFETLIAEHVDENPPMKSVEEDEEENNLEKEEDDDTGDEYEEERSEESSVETGDSSMKSNDEVIRPTESIEKLSLALKEMNYQNSGEKIGGEDRTVTTNDDISKDYSFYDYGNDVETTKKSMVISAYKEAIKLLTLNEQPVKSGKSRMLTLSILGTVLLLLMLGFLTHNEALFSYLINGDSVF